MIISWQDRAAQLKFNDGSSWDETTTIIRNEYFPELPWRTVHNKVRGTLRNHPSYKGNKSAVSGAESTDKCINCPENDADKSRYNAIGSSNVVGVIGDLHIPFEHPNYLQFCKDTFKQFGVSQVVSVGDLVDNHALSRHLTETCAVSPYDELDMAIDRLKEWIKAFPSVSICIGNHDSIPTRQAATIGIGSRYLKSQNELLNLPKEWRFEEEFIINNVLYKHGINCGGPNGSLNTAIQERMSTVIGHYHSGGGVSYSANPRDIIFGMQVGCGISISQYAFAYGLHSKRRPVLGCGVVFNDSYAIFVPMGGSYFIE